MKHVTNKIKISGKEYIIINIFINIIFNKLTVKK